MFLGKTDRNDLNQIEQLLSHDCKVSDIISNGNEKREVWVVSFITLCSESHVYCLNLPEVCIMFKILQLPIRILHSVHSFHCMAVLLPNLRNH